MNKKKIAILSLVGFGVAFISVFYLVFGRSYTVNEANASEFLNEFSVRGNEAKEHFIEWAAKEDFNLEKISLYAVLTQSPRMEPEMLSEYQFEMWNIVSSYHDKIIGKMYINRLAEKNRHSRFIPLERLTFNGYNIYFVDYSFSAIDFGRYENLISISDFIVSKEEAVKLAAEYVYKNLQINLENSLFEISKSIDFLSDVSYPVWNLALFSNSKERFIYNVGQDDVTIILSARTGEILNILRELN
ncbi:MAG: hypothetical protein FWF50_01505 [Defluviitaleaceae bacterium]|nr:hypothetical protein [Defluviitaleaceae bacterium]